MKAGELPKPVRDGAQQLALGFGRLTAPVRMTPAFLICGAQRSGTTSMYRTLSQHPAILKAVGHKGVHYFDTNYDRGMSWYRAHFPLQATAWRIGRSTGLKPMTFESSPYYLFHPLAPQRIANDLPGVRIIVLLRDPVERAYSAHAHEIARGYETEPFERALDLESSRVTGQSEQFLADPRHRSHEHQHQAYVARGRYVGQLERMAAAVGRDHLHVVDSDDFFADPEPAWREAVEFLGLPASPVPVFDRHNARPRSPMPETLRARLRESFAADDDALATWWGRTPSWRR